MQTILAFMASAFGGSAAAAGTTAAATATTATAATTAAAAGGGITALQVAGIGLSAVGALSAYGQSQMEARALKSEAFDSELQGRQEFTQAQEQATAIDREYQRVVAQQLAVASASGIDVSSGSVVEARRDAQSEADRQQAITRNGAFLNASLRRGRAAYLRGAAGLTREVGAVSAVAQLGKTAIDVSRLG